MSEHGRLAWTLADDLVGFNIPYGGADWPQREGWPVRQLIVRTTAWAIEPIIREAADE